MPSVLLTRSPEDNRRIAPCFESYGFTTRSIPLIELRTFSPGTVSIPHSVNTAPNVHVLLTSHRATEHWLRSYRQKLDDTTLRGYYVIGETSAELLREKDPTIPILEVGTSSADMLTRDFSSVQHLLYPCSARRREELVDTLRANGVIVSELSLYYPALPEGSYGNLHDALQSLEPDTVIVFYSPSAVRNFFILISRIPEHLRFAAIGATTAQELHDRGIHSVITPKTPETEELAQTIRNALAS